MVKPAVREILRELAASHERVLEKAGEADRYSMKQGYRQGTGDPSLTPAKAVDFLMVASRGMRRWRSTRLR